MSTTVKNFCSQSYVKSYERLTSTSSISLDISNLRNTSYRRQLSRDGPTANERAITGCALYCIYYHNGSLHKKPIGLCDAFAPHSDSVFDKKNHCLFIFVTQTCVHSLWCQIKFAEFCSTATLHQAKLLRSLPHHVASYFLHSKTRVNFHHAINSTHCNCFKTRRDTAH